MLKVRHLLFLACVVPAAGLCHGDSASAAFFGKGAAAFSRPMAGRALGRPFAGRPPALGPRAIAPPHGAFPQRDRAFNGPPGATPRQQFSHGFDRGPARQGRAFQHGLEHGPAVTTHAPLRNPSPLGSPGINAIARNGLPHRGGFIPKVGAVSSEPCARERHRMVGLTKAGTRPITSPPMLLVNRSNTPQSQHWALARQ